MPDVAENKDLLVALVGKMHTGKSTMADALVRECGFTRLAFADPLKEVSAQMLTVFLSYMNDQTLRRPEWWSVTVEMLNKQKGDPAIRKLLQLVGTELGRDWYGPDTIWIDLFRKRLHEKQTYEGTVRVVIDDCRFPNEADALKAMGFTIFRMERPELDRQQSIKNSLIAQKPELATNDLWLIEALETMANHPSESQVDQIHADYSIYAEDVDELRNKAITLTQFMKETKLYG